MPLGIDGIWVSNHGSRQLDGAVASVDALPAIAAAVGNRVPMIIDSGVRRGVDALKARAFGASAVAVGRAALYGAAAGGKKGARLALQILIKELRLAMKLAGTPSFNIAPETLALSQTTSAPATPIPRAGKHFRRHHCSRVCAKVQTS